MAKLFLLELDVRGPEGTQRCSFAFDNEHDRAVVLRNSAVLYGAEFVKTNALISYTAEEALRVVKQAAKEAGLPVGDGSRKKRVFES
jgi:hypothetical protein